MRYCLCCGHELNEHPAHLEGQEGRANDLLCVKKCYCTYAGCMPDRTLPSIPDSRS